MDMMQLGHSIAAMVDIGWLARKPAHGGDNSVVLTNIDKPKDYGVSLWHDEYRKKISISGLYPKASDGREFPFENSKAAHIYVTATKQPKLIAKDIREKFLPEYNPIVVRCWIHATGSTAARPSTPSMTGGATSTTSTSAGLMAR
jgi:hypothetical protein